MTNLQNHLKLTKCLYRGRPFPGLVLCFPTGSAHQVNVVWQRCNSGCCLSLEQLGALLHPDSLATGGIRLMSLPLKRSDVPLLIFLCSPGWTEEPSAGHSGIFPEE